MKNIENEFQLETRECVNCGMKFKVLPTSKQKLHAKRCNYYKLSPREKLIVLGEYQLKKD